MVEIFFVVYFWLLFLKLNFKIVGVFWVWVCIFVVRNEKYFGFKIDMMKMRVINKVIVFFCIIIIYSFIFEFIINII